MEADTYAAALGMLAFLHDNPGDLAALWMNEVLTPEQAEAVRAPPEDSGSFMAEAAAVREPYAALSAPLSMTVRIDGLPEMMQGATLSISAPSVRVGVNLLHELTAPERLSGLAANLYSSGPTP